MQSIFKRLSVFYNVRRCLLIDKLVQQTIKKSNSKDACLLIRPDAIGDYLLFRNLLPFYYEYAQSKGCELHIVGNQAWKPLAEAWDSKHFDVFYPINRKHFYRDSLYRFNFLKQIANHNYKETWAPVYSRLMLYDDAILNCSRARKKIGLEGDTENTIPKEKALTDKYYSQQIDNGTKYLFEFERNKYFLEQLTGKKIKVNLNLPKQEKPLISGKYLLLFPGAGDYHKLWPIKKYAALVSKFLNSYPDFKLYISGGSHERDLGRQLCQLLSLQHQKRTSLIFGDYPLYQVPNLIQYSQLLLCNDSMSAHIGALSKTPTLCFCTGQHYGRFMPYPKEQADNIYCVFPPEILKVTEEERYVAFRKAFGHSIESISVSQALKGLEELGFFL